MCPIRTFISRLPAGRCSGSWASKKTSPYMKDRPHQNPDHLRRELGFGKIQDTGLRLDPGYAPTTRNLMSEKQKAKRRSNERQNSTYGGRQKCRITHRALPQKSVRTRHWTGSLVFPTGGQPE